MKTILQTKLLPTQEQEVLLLSTMERFNAACDYVSEVAFKEKNFSKFKLQKLVYHQVKDKFSLTAQMAILAIRKVVDSYKLDKKVIRKFKPHGAIIYDQRVYSFKSDSMISLWTINGRERIQITYGQYQKAKWHQRKGQADLVYKDKKFHLLITVEAEEMPPIDPAGYLGVDLGIAKIASCSDGTEFSGEQVDAKRERFARMRKQLQSKGTKSAKRKLKKTSNKESNFRRTINHEISKQIVDTAKRSCFAIVLEDLTGIRKRMKARKANRSRMHGWSFFQLRKFIEYKAKIAGIPVHIIDPRYTSQRCSCCGHVSRKNRKNQAEFVCVSCGFVDNADHNASLNIAMLGRCQSATA